MYERVFTAFKIFMGTVTHSALFIKNGAGYTHPPAKVKVCPFFVFITAGTVRVSHPALSKILLYY